MTKEMSTDDTGHSFGRHRQAGIAFVPLIHSTAVAVSKFKYKNKESGRTEAMAPRRAVGSTYVFMHSNKHI